MTNPPPRPPVGNFRTSPENSVRESVKPKPVAPTLIPASMVRPPEAPPPAPPAEAEAPKDEPEADLTPRELYQKRLTEAGIELAVANSIFDAVMSKGYYEEYIDIGGRRAAVLRTRLYDDHLRLQNALELQRPTLVLTQEDMITRYNLAASLYEWRGRALAHDTDDDFDKVLTLIKKLPAPVYSMLAQRLATFDRKVMTVFSDGAADSF